MQKAGHVTALLKFGGLHPSPRGCACCFPLEQKEFGGNGLIPTWPSTKDEPHECGLDWVPPPAPCFQGPPVVPKHSQSLLFNWATCQN